MSNTHLTGEQIAALKTRLLDEKARLEAEREVVTSEDRSDTEEGAPGELAGYDPNDPADIGTNTYDRERNFANIDNVNRIVGKIDRALAKIDEGTYGLSDVDGAPIPYERLEALPYAVRTVEQEDDVI